MDNNLREIDFNELNLIAGGIDTDVIPQDGTYRFEIKETGGRRIMYVYDHDGNVIMMKELTEEPAWTPNPEAYQDFLNPGH